MADKNIINPDLVKYPKGSTREKVGILERGSYANLDFAGQLVATIVNSYLMYFFTDVAMISAAATGTILLVARIVDAIGALHVNR